VLASGEEKSTPSEWHKRFGWVPAVQIEPIAVNDGVISLNGYGVRVAVRNGQLELADGLGSSRRAARFSRATCGIKRLVVRGSAYFITGDALAWLTEIGASFLNVGFDGEILAAWSPPKHDDARLRRAQALAPWTDTGLSLTKYLLREKLLGQTHVLERRFPEQRDALATVRQYMETLEATTDPLDLRRLEGAAASAYWSAWETLPLTFAKRDLPRIPDHWRTFGSRMSAVSGVERSASNPANALLNYLYAILEAETRTACVVAGLDPGLGLFHTDLRKRQSLALDVMEPMRPQVDLWLYDTLQHRAWTWDDFGELQSGVCRVLPPLTHALSETALTWYKAIGPYVEHVARTLFASADTLTLPSGLIARANAPRSDVRYPARLTHANHRAAREPFRTGSRASREPVPPKVPAACHSCGVVLADADRKYCADCLPQFVAERRTQMRAVGQAKLQALSEAGTDPRSTEAARKKHSERSTAMHQAIAAWEAMHGRAQNFDPAIFIERIYPRLGGVKPMEIVRATGLSAPYCLRIRTGGRIPHPMHWETLAKLVGVDGTAGNLGGAEHSNAGEPGEDDHSG